MAVPETPVYEKDRMIFGKNKVRMTGDFRVVKPVAESLSVKTFPDKNFRLCVSGPDAPHHAASGGFVDDIYHRTLCGKDSFKNSGSLRVFGRNDMRNHDFGHFGYNRNNDGVSKLPIRLRV